MPLLSENTINLFSTIFLGIMLEAIPFLLFGTLLSSIIEVFVPDEFFEKHIPKNRLLAILLASLSGLVFPVCECAIIPVAGRLLKKGVPLHFATTFVLAVPIINVPVILSTYYAFSSQPLIPVLRIGCGFAIACAIGFIASFVKKKEGVLLASADPRGECKRGCTGNGNEGGRNHAEEHGNPGHSHYESTGDILKPANDRYSAAKHEPVAGKRRIAKKILAVLDHTTSEFFETGKYLLLGALVTALFQSLIPRSVLAGLGGNPVLSTVVMVCFAYLLSICSQTDAFIARSFMGQFPHGALVGFMVVGAMIDLKNTAMLGRIARKRYIAIFIALVCGLGLAVSVAINIILGR